MLQTLVRPLHPQSACCFGELGFFQSRSVFSSGDCKEKKLYHRRMTSENFFLGLQTGCKRFLARRFASYRDQSE